MNGPESVRLLIESVLVEFQVLRFESGHHSLQIIVVLIVLVYGPLINRKPSCLILAVHRLVVHVTVVVLVAIYQWYGT